MNVFEPCALLSDLVCLVINRAKPLNLSQIILNRSLLFSRESAGSLRRPEVEPGFATLRALAAVGIVWDLREPPARVLEAGRRADAERRKRGRRAPEPVAVAARESAHGAQDESLVPPSPVAG